MKYTIALIVSLAFWMAIGAWPLQGIIIFLALAIIGVIINPND